MLKLYIAGAAPNSMRAKANLAVICRQYLHDSHDLEIIDVLIDPGRALRNHVVVTPTLVKVAPEPVVRIVGDLGEHAKVMEALGLEQRSDE